MKGEYDDDDDAAADDDECAHEQLCVCVCVRVCLPVCVCVCVFRGSNSQRIVQILTTDNYCLMLPADVCHGALLPRPFPACQCVPPPHLLQQLMITIGGHFVSCNYVLKS